LGYACALSSTEATHHPFSTLLAGNVRAPGSGAEIVRMSALLAGVPVTAGATACNRQCSSGLQAIAAAAGMIRLGTYDTAIAGGFESMSQL